MPKLTLATLYTDIVEFREPNAPTEGGQFTVPVEIYTDLMRRDPSPRTYFFRQIGHVLFYAVSETGVPHEYWWAEFSPEAKNWFGLPERQKLKL